MNRVGWQIGTIRCLMEKKYHSKAYHKNPQNYKTPKKFPTKAWSKLIRKAAVDWCYVGAVWLASSLNVRLFNIRDQKGHSTQAVQGSIKTVPFHCVQTCIPKFQSLTVNSTIVSIPSNCNLQIKFYKIYIKQICSLKLSAYVLIILSFN